MAFPVCRVGRTLDQVQVDGINEKTTEQRSVASALCEASIRLYSLAIDHSLGFVWSEGASINCHQHLKIGDSLSDGKRELKSRPLWIRLARGGPLVTKALCLLGDCLCRKATRTQRPYVVGTRWGSHPISAAPRHIRRRNRHESPPQEHWNPPGGTFVSKF